MNKPRSPEIPKTKSAFKPITPSTAKPAQTTIVVNGIPRIASQKAPPAKPAAAPEPTESPPATPSVTVASVAKPELPSAPVSPLVPSTVDVFVHLQNRPDRAALGGVYALDTRQQGGRAIVIVLYKGRPVVTRAIAQANTITLRFLIGMLLAEWLKRKQHKAEIKRILDAVEKLFGGPWKEFQPNGTHLACLLAEHSVTEGLDLLDAKGPIRCITIEAQLPEKSSLWQWNAGLPRPEPKKAETPGKDTETK